MSSSNGVGAFSARVRVAEPGHVAQAARVQRVRDLASDADRIKQKITALDADSDADQQWRDRQLSALRANLEAVTAEAEQARREAQEGAQ